MKISSKKLVLILWASILCVMLGIWGAKKSGFIVYTGDKYSEQGRLLSKTITMDLISRGFCSSPKECIEKLDVYIDHDLQINYTIYNTKNKKMVAAFIGIAIEKGLETTDGVPISISVYPEMRTEYRGRPGKDNTIINVGIMQ